MRAFHWGAIVSAAIVMPTIAFALQTWWPEAAEWYPSYGSIFWYVAGAFGFWISGKAA